MIPQNIICTYKLKYFGYRIEAMDIDLLPIELVRQHPKSDDCLRACGLMILKYFDDSVSKSEVWKRLHVYKKHSGLWGGYLTDLGMFVAKKDYKSVIYHHDWHWWDEETVNTSEKGEELTKALKILKKEKREWAHKKLIAKEIKYLNSGGKLIFQKPGFEIINYYLQKKIPVILSVRGEDIYKNPKEDFNHALVIAGKSGKNYIVKDSYQGLEKIETERLMVAWIRAGGWMMVIEPTAAKKVKQEKLMF